MRLLVLGGTQFVGRHLVAAAIEAGHEVTLFNRGQTNPGLFAEARQLVGDRTAGDLGALKAGEWDGVVDVNAYVPRVVREVAEALDGSYGHYTFISTGSVYDLKAGAPITEDGALTAVPDDPTDEEVTNDSYGGLKVLCEQAAVEAFAGHCTIVRPGIVAGPYDPTDRFTWWARRMAEDGTIDVSGRGDQAVQVIDGRDLGAFTLALTIEGRTGTFNGVGPAEPITLEDLSEICAASAQKTTDVRFGVEGAPLPPLVLPDDRSYDSIFQVSPSKSLASGLVLRPLAETAADTLAWADSAVTALYSVVAKNFATTSENKIHEDTVAKQYGFEGGLVPGVTTWAYMIHPVVETFGIDWLQRGTIGTRFVKPVYEEDTVEVGLTDEGELTATNDSGIVCATGQAALPAKTRLFEVSDYPTSALPASPDERPPAAVERLTKGTVLGTLEIGFHTDRHGEYLAQIDEQLPVFADVCHPGFLMRQANYVLSQNVRLGPWIHVESVVQMLSLVGDGDRIGVRAKVADEFERKGNRFVDMDILYVANDERPVMHVRHVAIWQLRPSG